MANFMMGLINALRNHFFLKSNLINTTFHRRFQFTQINMRSKIRVAITAFVLQSYRKAAPDLKKKRV